ncbi:MAG: M13 family peptidase, partial [Dysgonamonadaceae bacterium]
MNRIPFLSLVLLATFSTGCLQQKSSNNKMHPTLDISNLDTTVAPGTDFYRYATGGWQDANPLPPEYSRYGSFEKLAE